MTGRRQTLSAAGETASESLTRQTCSMCYVRSVSGNPRCWHERGQQHANRGPLGYQARLIDVLCRNIDQHQVTAQDIVTRSHLTAALSVVRLRLCASLACQQGAECIMYSSKVIPHPQQRRWCKHLLVQPRSPIVLSIPHSASSQNGVQVLSCKSMHRHILQYPQDTSLASC